MLDVMSHETGSNWAYAAVHLARKADVGEDRNTPLQNRFGAVWSGLTMLSYDIEK
jgi:hypothetical protein